MADVTATRRIQFCAGHRVAQHESKCRNMHGHNYVVLVTAAGVVRDQVVYGVDALGRVIDFSVLKDKIGGWIDEHWDHGFIVWKDDTEVLGTLAAIPGQKMFQLPCNPTAENMAAYLLEEVGPQALVGTGVRLTKVVVWETENCYAEAT